MDIGDEILLKVKIIDFDINPHGSAVKVEITGYMDREEGRSLKSYDKPLRFGIHRFEPNTIVNGTSKGINKL